MADEELSDVLGPDSLAWCAALTPVDRKNVSYIIRALKNHLIEGAHGERVHLAAVGGSVQKALWRKTSYNDIDLAVTGGHLDLDEFFHLAVRQGLCEGIKLDSGQIILISDRYEFKQVTSRKYIYGNWENKQGTFIGPRIVLQTSDNGAPIDLMYVTGSSIGDKQYGSVPEEWLRAQKEQKLPYLVLLDHTEALLHLDE